MALALAALLMVFILLENLLVLLETMIQFFVAITIIIIFLPSLIVIRSYFQKSSNDVQGDQSNDALLDHRKFSKIELQISCEDIIFTSIKKLILVT